VSDDEIVGTKALTIQATVRYPIVSAYEFEFLKKEAEVRAYLKPCTLYVIVQRPLMVINRVAGDNGVIRFTIDDDTPSAPLECEIDPVAADMLDATGGEFFLDLQFFRGRDREDQPFDEVAGFKILDGDRTFKAWVTAERFLFHYFKGTPGFTLTGDVAPYMDYTVHYIGKAFNQGVWQRLTGHEKMQKVLTLEPSKNVRSLGAPFEISLMLIAIVGADELLCFPYMGWPKFKNPILHKISSDSDMDQFHDSWVKMPSAELTSEAEAKLIHSLKPAYNEKLFDSYPYIAKGARSLGYSHCDLQIDMMPAVLHTRHAKFAPVLPSELNDFLDT
jgi:hypothetical protein